MVRYKFVCHSNKNSVRTASGLFLKLTLAELVKNEKSHRDEAKQNVEEAMKINQQRDETAC